MTDSIGDRLRACWQRSDEIFGLLEPDALFEQPIALRYPLIFYLGHLPAFAWNQVCRGALRMASFRHEFDLLFERGIDPIGVDRHEESIEWPSIDEVIAYKNRVREELAGAIESEADCPRILEVAVEHELMHQETLQYLLQQLPYEHKRHPEPRPKYLFDGAAPAKRVLIGGGPVVLGADFDATPFGWDNEFPELEVTVDDFVVDRMPVRNSEFLEFVEDGGYQRPELWRDDDWQWRESVGLLHPVFWSRDSGNWIYFGVFDSFSLDRVADWPVYMSHAEAEAFCRWRGGRLMSEAEFHRAAFSMPDGGVRAYPWGDEPPAENHGNFGFRHWAPTPVGSFPGGDSAWGVAELVGNGWEWTDSVFEPYPGFTANIPSYPGSSADFFDGLHHVLL